LNLWNHGADGVKENPDFLQNGKNPGNDQIDKDFHNPGIPGIKVNPRKITLFFVFFVPPDNPPPLS
jgi:hypothetical protein